MSTNLIAPVLLMVSRMVAAAPTAQADISWQKPAISGVLFNVRQATNNAYLDYYNWPLVAAGLNTNYVRLGAIDPTRFFCISYTNPATGVEANDQLSPVSVVIK